MVSKIKLDGKEYEVENLSDEAQRTLELLNFASERLRELLNMKAVLLRSRNSYLKDLKSEIISKKSGLVFGEE